MTDVKILGTGCAKCKMLDKRVRQICEKNNIQAEIEKVEDIDRIIEFGVISTPALVVNGQVKATGRIPKEQEIMGWLHS